MLDAYLELLNGGQPAVTGECLDAVFSKKKAMQLTSFTLSSQVDLTGGKPEREDEEAEEIYQPPGPQKTPSKNLFTFTITKEIDNATPDLLLGFCQRWATQNVTWELARVTVRKAGGGLPAIDYLIYEFTNVYVRSWTLENQDADDLPEEEVEFAFDTCRMQYYPQSASGVRKSMKEGGWDFGNHKQMQ